MTIDEIKIKKRRPPMTRKKCDNCCRTFNVMSSRKFCKDTTCEGSLELVPKEKEHEVKGNAPKCDKHCNTCNLWYIQVPCATKKCNCGSNLYKVTWPDIVEKVCIYVEPID